MDWSHRTKTSRSRRPTITVPAPLIDALREHRVVRIVAAEVVTPVGGFGAGVAHADQGNSIEVTRRGWDDQPVLRVYLDQNKWIELSRSRKGGFTDDLADVWHLAAAGVDRGFVSFPLSAIHYYETTKRRDQQSRWELASTMAELSRMHTIAGPNTLVPLEVDAAVAKLVAGSPPPPPIQAFGVGAAHALGAAPNTFTGLFSDEELRAAGVPNDVLDVVHRGLVDAVEFAVLALTEFSPNAQAIVAQTRTQMEAVNRMLTLSGRSPKASPSTG